MVSVYGFAAAFDDHTFLLTSTQLVKRMSPGVLVLPFVGDSLVTVDFADLELSGDITKGCTKYLMLCNPHQRNYRWTIKPSNGKSKSEAFDWITDSGDISAYETFTIPFRFKSIVSGRYETSCDISIFDSTDRKDNVIVSVTVVLLGNAVFSSLIGVPESIQFNNTLINSVKKFSFQLSNIGSTNLSIKTILKAPFSISPSNCLILSKAKQQFVLSFSPNTYKIWTEKLQLFANQNLFCVPVAGCGGIARIECDKYAETPLEFGTCKQSTVAWLSIYLTNTGTLPSFLVGISSTSGRKYFQCMFVETVHIIPLEIYQSKDANQLTRKMDYWSFLREKVRLFKYLEPIFNGSKRFFVDKDTSRKSEISKQKVTGSSLIIQEHDQLNYYLNLLGDTVSLKPHHSYHLRVGFTADAIGMFDSELIFSYAPDIPDAEDTGKLPELIQTLSIEINALVVKPLEIVPRTIDFGVSAAECFLMSKFAKKSADHDNNLHLDVEDPFSIQVFNMSDKSQNLSLDFITSEFSTCDRQWKIKAGGKVQIPIKFHPGRAQTNFHGEACFSHDHGKDTIHLLGIGASAELVIPENIDFGRLKVGTLKHMHIPIYNNGVMTTKFEMDFIQDGQMYSFDGEEPFEANGFIDSGCMLKVDLKCFCKVREPTPGFLVIRWKRVPLGKTENTMIRLIMEAGYPTFDLYQVEFDYKSTFIGVNKSLPCMMANKGNASCNWKVICESPMISMDIGSGILAAYCRLHSSW